MTPSDARLKGARRDRRFFAPGPAIRLAAVLCLLPTAMLVAERTTGQQPAGRIAAPAVGLSFTDFHGLSATVDYLQKTAAAHPDLAELVEIGRTAGNRPIHVLVVSNMKTGTAMDKLVPLSHPRAPAVNNVVPMKPYQAKPGQWIDGGLHGTGRVGTEACLYIVDKLISGYGNDAEITRLVDDNVFYIAPVIDADVFAAVSQGKPAPGEPAAEANGNFPEGWWKDDNTPGGVGDFPSSLPEARAILEFFTNHTNILLVQSFGAGGTTTYRPFSRWPESRVDARDLAVLDRLIGKKYLELVGEPVPASWNAPMSARPAAEAAPAGSAAQGRGRGTGAGRGTNPPASDVSPDAAQGRPAGTRQADQPRSWRSPYTNAPAGFGVFFDWAYGQFGAYAMSTQLPDPKADTLAKVCDTAWQFERFKATLLPRVAITEASAKVLYTTNNATRAQAAEDGEAVVVRKAAGAPGRYRVVEVTATVENTGALPTGVARATQLRGNREDVIWLLGNKVTFLTGSRWLRLGLLPGTAPLPGAGAAAEPAPAGMGRGGGGRGGRGGAAGGELALAQMREQRPAETPAVTSAGNRRTVRWLVAVEGDVPLKLALTSQRGGTKVKDLAIQ